MYSPSASNSRKQSFSRTRHSQLGFHQYHHEPQEPAPLNEEDEGFADEDTDAAMVSDYEHEEEFVTSNMPLGLDPADTTTKTLSSGFLTPQRSTTKNTTAPARSSTSHTSVTTTGTSMGTTNNTHNKPRVSQTHSRHSSMGKFHSFLHSPFDLNITDRDSSVLPNHSLQISSHPSGSQTSHIGHTHHITQSVDRSYAVGAMHIQHIQHTKPRASIDPSTTATGTTIGVSSRSGATTTVTDTTVTSSGSDKPLKRSSLSGQHSHQQHRRKSSLYGQIKHICRSSISNIFGAEEEEDTEEKEYYNFTVTDKFNVMLSDPDGLSHLADHLCAEFSMLSINLYKNCICIRYMNECS